MAEPTKITRGVSYRKEIPGPTTGGIPDDMTGYAFRAQVRQPDGLLVADLSAGISLKSGSTDTVAILFSDEDTWALDSGSWAWDVLADRPDGHVDLILPTRPFIVATPATRPAASGGVTYSYLRPGGVDSYFRPGGVDTYIRP